MLRIFQKLTPKLVLLSISCYNATYAQAKNEKNVLFIIVDDLRNELGCYGCENVITPNIDKLATSSILFKNAYCNIPVSGASRASLLTGIYPDYSKKRFIDAETYAQKDLPDVETLPQVFKNNGYYTSSVGKVFHHYDDRIDSWSEEPWIVSPASGDWAVYNKWNVWKKELSEQDINPKNKRGPYWESANIPDSCYEDNKIARKAITQLQILKENGKPFFLAVGFRKPHLPFNAPKKYFDYYSRKDIRIETDRCRPTNLPKQVKSSQEIFQYTHTNNTTTDEFHQEARHAYYSCVSFIDAQIGLVINKLKQLELDKNTIIILVGDNGWHLGEHNFWGKHTLLKQSTKAPLIFKMPGCNGGKSKSIVEFVDIYPTLCDVCNITPPTHLQGKSFMPTILNPRKKHKDYAFIQWGNGINIVTDKYSYAEWHDKSNNMISNMLYNHQIDSAEKQNIAQDYKNEPLIKKFKQYIEDVRQKL